MSSVLSAIYPASSNGNETLSTIRPGRPRSGPRLTGPPEHLERRDSFNGGSPNSHVEASTGSRLPDQPDASAADAVAPKPSATSITFTMASLCLSATLSALDLTIVTTAVPNIVASLQSVAGYIWVGSAFILGFTAVNPVWGSVADLWGRKPIILSALSIFLVGSLLCALAPHMNALIAGRAV